MKFCFLDLSLILDKKILQYLCKSAHKSPKPHNDVYLLGRKAKRKSSSSPSRLDGSILGCQSRRARRCLLHAPPLILSREAFAEIWIRTCWHSSVRQSGSLGDQCIKSSSTSCTNTSNWLFYALFLLTCTFLYFLYNNTHKLTNMMMLYVRWLHRAIGISSDVRCSSKQSCPTNILINRWRKIKWQIVSHLKKSPILRVNEASRVQI